MTAPRAGFEGSYLGANDRISDQAIMECKICWTPYDPAQGDDFRQVLPGTPFAALPEDWHCPNCDAPKEQFIVQSDPGAPGLIEQKRIDDQVALLVADFREIWHAKMRDVPLVNKALSIEAVGFMPYEGRGLGVLMSPWFMNLIVLPGEGEDWSTLTPGDKEDLRFPSGTYEFIHNRREMVGGYKACALFSAMGDFQTQMQARDVARAVMGELFKEENRAETTRSGDIRAAREAELAAVEAAEVEEAEAQARAEALVQPSRRQLISAGLASDKPEEGTA
ncbi:[NiFe] hydrogenase assembly HybE family chaperone [Rhodobacter sp. JA431]|uniref:[NiFe]-hydrogenase assembly chaperone HybE n=1 Tax=Rhodobacter sp. JA431 TaxID=570013 RepID=UPI000BC7AD7A|nr:[NiFe]-hydrogenase assembly chaperone HybE [Rhodobacter sp. JA431]SOB89844.1 [NiFe] hydrogenase assembly HybE family chaperone [Rhodobacter sp. JA431]